MAIAAFSELLALYTLPFVANRFVILLDATISLLESQSKNVLNKNPITQEERDYDISLQTIKNPILELNEVDHFKKKIEFVKQNASGMLENALAQLPEAKQVYLKNIFKTKVINNEARVIFKIKK